MDKNEWAGSEEVVDIGYAIHSDLIDLKRLRNVQVNQLTVIG